MTVSAAAAAAPPVPDAAQWYKHNIFLFYGDLMKETSIIDALAKLVSQMSAQWDCEKFFAGFLKIYPSLSNKSG